MAHPCLTCGACCATWPVQFARSEVTQALRAYVVAAPTPRHRVLKGTEGDAPRCVALGGAIGERSRCAIYAHRPSPCVEVQASWEHGERDPTCDEAREHHGLARLRPSDW